MLRFPLIAAARTALLLDPEQLAGYLIHDLGYFSLVAPTALQRWIGRRDHLKRH